MPKMEGQQIIRVSAHAILQSQTLYILYNTHKTSLIAFVNRKFDVKRKLYFHTVRK